MKKSKTISLFNIAFVLAINLYFQNIYLLIASSLYLLIINYKNFVIFVLLLVPCMLINTYVIDPIPYGYIDYVSSKYVYVDKILYRCKVETLNTYEVGQIVKTSNSSEKLVDKTKNKNNILFINYDDPVIIFDKTLLSKNIKLLNNKNVKEKDIYKQLLFNENTSTDFDYCFGYGFCLYYILKIIFKRNKYISITLMLIYSLLFGFDIKFILLIIDFILSFFKFKQKDRFGFKLIVISIMNINLLNNYSILISLLFNLLFMTKYSNTYVLSVAQSLLFGQIQILTTIYYKYYLVLRIVAFIFALIGYLFPFMSNITIFLLSILSYIFKIITFHFRGKINILLVLLLKLIFNILKIKNNYIKQAILIVILLLNLSNPFDTITFIDVGQGDAILLSSSFNKENILIDTGSSFNYYKLKTKLYQEGIYKIDYLIITHDDSDHNGNINNLVKDFTINNIIEEPTNINTDNFNLININFGEFDNDNENSLIYIIEKFDLKFLFTGDITKNIERLIIKSQIIDDIDVLKVSHHGSKTGTSSYFIGKLLPEIAIISTNGLYGHPDQEVINILDSYLVDTFITKEEGDISFYLSNLINIIKTDNNRFVIIEK